ncbi:MAG: SPASM domain-containing protein [Candidatus Bathyarchaeia archaeon]
MTTSCPTETESMFLDPYGIVYPCIFTNYLVENLREASLKGLRKLWMLEGK